MAMTGANALEPEAVVSFVPLKPIMVSLIDGHQGTAWSEAFDTAWSKTYRQEQACGTARRTLAYLAMLRLKTTHKLFTPAPLRPNAKRSARGLP